MFQGEKINFLNDLKGGRAQEKWANIPFAV